MQDAAQRFRAQFPALTDTVHLASCSQGAASTRMISALQEFQWSLRSFGAPWDRWMGKVDEARRAFARQIGATPEEIAVVGCASEGAFQVASTIDWGRRNEIVTTDMEFPSVAHVWLAQRRAHVRHVPECDGIVRTEDYLAAIGETTGLVSVPLASYRNGLRLPATEVIEAAHAAGARVFVDAYQAAGVMPIDVKALGCDYLVAGALKYLLGVPGIAFLYVRAGLRDDLEPQLTGWFGRTNPYAFDPRSIDFPAAASRFETGTPAIPSAYAAVAGMETLAGADPRAVDAHVRQLVDLAHDRLTEIGRTLWSPADPALRGPQVALVDDDPDALAARLRERRIVTSPRGTVLRLSFHYYNDASDVDAVIDALQGL
jgi:selenocysteine lyase/cysteine desulfurase